MKLNYNDNLYNAVLAGDERKVFKFLLKEANPNYETEEGLTPLTRAILNGHDNIVEILLEAGADPNWEVLSRGLPFDIIRKQKGLRHLKLYFLTLNSTAFSYSLDCPNSPLYIAIAMSNVKIIKMLLKYGAKANYLETETKKNANNIPPIIFAILISNYKVVSALLPAIKHIDEKWGKNDETPLMVALNLRALKIAKLLIEKGADVNAKDRTGCTPLLIAIEHYSSLVVKKLLKYGAIINTEDEKTYSPLMRAAYLGENINMTVLLKSNANVNQENKYFKSALMQAILGKGDISTVKLLLKYGANFNASFEGSCTPLIAAIRRGDPLLVEELLKAGANPNQQNKFGETPLIVLATLYKFNARIAKLLVKYGAKLNCESKRGTPLMYAAQNSNIDIIKCFIKLGADVNYQHNKGNALLAAISWWRVDTVKFLLSVGAVIPQGKALYEAVLSMSGDIINILLENGADPMHINDEDFRRIENNIKCYPIYYRKVAAIVNRWIEQRKSRDKAELISKLTSDNTIIRKAFKAIEDSDASVIKHILQTGTDPNSLINEQGLTLLGKACQSGCYMITELLLKNKVDPNQHKAYDFAPITQAVRFGHFNIVKLLLKYGADPTIEDSGDNLLQEAAVWENQDMLELLLKTGANPNLENPVLSTPFSRAVHFRGFEIVRLFLENGADPNLGNIYGNTLLLHAIINSEEETAILLLEYGASPLLTNFNLCTGIAIKQGKTKIGQMLIDTGAINLIPKNTSNKYSVLLDSKAKDQFPRKSITEILDTSIQYKHFGMVKFLLSNFKEFKLTAKDIEKGFNWAAVNGELKILKQLMKHILYLNSYDKSINISSALISLVKMKEPELEQSLSKDHNTTIKTNTVEVDNPQQSLH
ncbi:ankyrin [endosymbiont of Acanthamoeba sp. UWC8]|uniref:ankyrin repeat domain-containing protein n=1 Tax=endosymbiont of Acanthamoeba sp. UWC8 TaxID=86106 RepID=UPI0004D1544F|nr:ankyrin repeat domain-containing protein [endosymbiont of Acanthamoeba sp. UWC8]AIF81395.1 ankyrin [endosymbiont of Acanthamoeba sp. UWC8]